MVTALMSDLQHLFGAQAAPWATQLHAGVLSLLAAAWGLPVVLALFRRLPKSEPEIEWVWLWRCPRCQSFNRRSFVTCTHCEYHRVIGGLARWIPISLAEKFKRGGRRLVFLYKLAGWGLYYGATGLAFWRLRLYTFQQEPLQELVGSAMMLMLLLSLMFFHLAFRPRFKSPLAFVTDILAATVFAACFLFGSLVWSAAPYPPQAPLAQLQTTVGDVIRLTPKGDPGKDLAGIPSGGAIRVDVTYEVVSWPLFRFRRVYFTSPHQKRAAPWTLTVMKLISPFLQTSARFRPYLSSLRQSFVLERNTAYTLSESRDTPGLALHKLGSLPKKNP